ncbi:NAD(P)-binding domain-containing protein [Chryseolinea sp. T2]|uniref:NADPH-dependent F420 reductase n=1 Tax=Chryseolinea sp. T2 TaxID=3129255 RepID=UPI00307820C3
MSTNKSKVAVIGLGNIGKVVASNLVSGGREVIVASRKIEDAKAFASELGNLATATDVKSAIKDAGIVILSVWFNTIQELFKQYPNELKGKIVIDPSNPIAPDGNGGFKKVIGADESAGQILKGLLPDGATLVKALGSLGAASLAGEAFKKPGKVLFYAADDKSVNNTIETLIKDSGFEPVNIGGIDQSIRMEVFGELHEYGALGKAVTKAELKQPA